MGRMSEMLTSTPAVPTATPAAPPASILRVPARDQGGIYLIDGRAGKFLTNVDMGGTLYASFAPVGGGSPIICPVDKETPAAPIVLPPDAPKSDPTLAAMPPPSPVPFSPIPPPKEAPAAVQAPAMTVVAIPAVPSTASVAPLTIGLQTPASQALAGVTAATTAPVAPPEVEAPAAGKRGRKPKAEPADRIYIYIGCAPIGEQTSTLGVYVQELDSKLHKAVQLESEGSDVRAANDQALGFGKWQGWLAKAALESPPPAGHYVTTAGDVRQDVVVAALLTLPGTRVVMGYGR